MKSLPVSVFPGSVVPVTAGDGRCKLSLAHWGLTPSWVEHPKTRDLLINARAETLASKPSFSRLFLESRCAMFAEAFYEWSVVPGMKRKQKWLIRLKSREPFCFAGLLDLTDIAQTQTAGNLPACALITSQPNKLVRRIHNRMPAILRREAIEPWLSPDEKNPDRLQNLLVAYPDDEMEALPENT